jgi:hypothetical protein
MVEEGVAEGGGPGLRKLDGNLAAEVEYVKDLFD